MMYGGVAVELHHSWEVSVHFLVPAPSPPGKEPWYPLDRGLGGPQSRSGCCGEEKNLVPAGNRTQAIQPVALCYTD
jgi:hypothetical protein